MNYVELDAETLQDAFNAYPKEGYAIHIEPLTETRLQFRWKGLCEQADKAELEQVLRDNNVIASDSHVIYDTLARHIATRFLMQRITLREPMPCE